MTGNLDMNNNGIYNIAQPNGDNQPATKVWSENKFLDKSSGVMAGSLNINKITHLATATANGDAVSRFYCDGRYVKKGGDKMTGALSVPNMNYSQSYDVVKNHVVNYYDLLSKFLLKSGGAMSHGRLWNLQNPPYEDSRGNSFAMPRIYADGRYFRKSQEINMGSNKITYLADPQLDKDAINKQYLEKSHVKPSRYNNEFKYLMTNILTWTDLEPDSFDIAKIDNLMPKMVTTINTITVLYNTIIKDQQGGYSYKIGINCYQLDKDKDYALCIEILNSDYQLWHINQLLQLIKPHHMGYQLLILRYKSFLTGTQIVMVMLSTSTISK